MSGATCYCGLLDQGNWNSQYITALLIIVMLKITLQPSKSIRIRVMMVNTTFNNISVILWPSVLLVEETWVPGENHRPVASHWQTLSHNVVSSTPAWAGFELITLIINWWHWWKLAHLAWYNCWCFVFIYCSIPFYI